MRTKWVKVVCCFLFMVTSFLFSVEKQPDIRADRRVLVRVRNSIITAADVLKKMDLVFYQQFPQFRSVTKERLRFHETNWKRVLRDLLERRMVMIFAEENHVEIQHGDIREELEGMFGPNMLLSLYDAKISMDDAYEMVRQDIMMRRILSFYVKAAVISSITPQKIRERYQLKYGNERPQEKISWCILSLKAPEPIDSKALIEQAITSLNIEGVTIEQVQKTMPENCEIRLSPTFVTESSKIAPTLKPTIDDASLNVWTTPQSSQDPKTGHVKWSSYLVKARVPGEKTPLRAVEDELREELMAPILEEKKKLFMEDLMKKYDVSFAMSEQEMDTYHPFHLE